MEGCVAFVGGGEPLWTILGLVGIGLFRVIHQARSVGRVRGDTSRMGQ